MESNCSKPLQFPQWNVPLAEDHPPPLVSTRLQSFSHPQWESRTVSPIALHHIINWIAIEKEDTPYTMARRAKRWYKCSSWKQWDYDWVIFPTCEWDTVFQGLRQEKGFESVYTVVSKGQCSFVYPFPHPIQFAPEFLWELLNNLFPLTDYTEINSLFPLLNYQKFK